MPLCRCKAHKSHSLCMILRSSRTLKKHVAKVGLTFCITLCRCKVEESHSFRVVLRNAFAFLLHAGQISHTLCISLIYSEAMMLAHVYLKQGAIVPAHDHNNEQFTYILSGRLRFWIGAHADAPGDTYVDVSAGEVLVIPSMVRHRAEALEDTLDVDIFNPPRQDWIDKSDNYLRTGEPMSNGGQG